MSTRRTCTPAPAPARRSLFARVVAAAVLGLLALVLGLPIAAFLAAPSTSESSQ